jgi:hypothetical protein
MINQPEEKKTGGPFSQLENGVQKMQRQVSFRIQRKNILRKTLTSDRWIGAARKVKVRAMWLFRKGL